MATADSIRFNCGGCGHGIRVAVKHAGRKAKCPKCAAGVVVPRPMDADDDFDLDGFEVEEPAGYDLAEDIASPAEPAHRAGPGPASQPRPSEPPKLMPLLKNEKGGVFAVLFFFIPWVCFLLVAADIVSPGTPRDRPMTISVLLYMSLAVTAVTLPFAFWRFSRAWGIMSHGVEVRADLIDYSTPVGHPDISKGTFEYAYEGQVYRLVASFPTDDAGRPQTVIVDARHPQRALRKG